MADKFIFSDSHFGHANILNFRVHDADCSKRMPELKDMQISFDDCDCPKMRPEFDTVEQMDDFIVQSWNEVVKPQDKVYHLGDVAMAKRHVPTIGRCNGHKRLVRGNHDNEKLKLYAQFFEEIYATRQLDNDLLLSHIPIHPESLRHNWTNVHGHTHNNLHPLHFGVRYLNVSCEVTGYKPLHLDEVRARIKKQREDNQNAIEANLSRMGITPLWSEEELYGPGGKH